MRTLYNLGRSVGLSAYELYVRQVLANDPQASILSEREWLAASVGDGNSMIMKVPSGTKAGYYDTYLPEGSDLCGCSTMHASMFEGEVQFDDSEVWAERVNDYGRLVANYGVHFPATPGESENVPAKDNPGTITSSIKEQAENYIKITSALMFQPGSWIENVNWVELLDENGLNILTESGIEVLAGTKTDVRAMALRPDLAKRGFIRLAISEDITADVLILISGFMPKTVMGGFVGFDDIITNPDSANGGFLGPQTFPWACKINLNMTTDVFAALNLTSGTADASSVSEGGLAEDESTTA